MRGWWIKLALAALAALRPFVRLDKAQAEAYDIVMKLLNEMK